MEVDQDLRFVCKLCNKNYPCGKSLGGHMRSHMTANATESDESNIKTMMFTNISCKNFSKESKVVAEFCNGQTSYGLRENPKKTWRAVGAIFPSPTPPEKVCKQCGKGFQSMKALCGHMACHSSSKDDQSWTCENPRIVIDSHSDTEVVEDGRLRTRLSLKSKKYKNVVDNSSSISEIDEQEQEDLALCLMMLSRDCGNKGGVNSLVESWDNNSVVLETKSSSIDMKVGQKQCLDYVPSMMKIEDSKLKAKAIAFDDDDDDDVESSDSGYFLDESTKLDSDLSDDAFYKNTSFNHSNKPFIFEKERMKQVTKGNGYGTTLNSAKIESQKRKYISEGKRVENGSKEVRNKAQTTSKYECLNCKKVFNSYQALGGHRPCHKRMNTRYESQYETAENSLDDSGLDYRATHKPVAKTSSYIVDKKVNKPKKNKVHVCPFCHKVYKNGQALGGHKRSHFLGGHWENNVRAREMKPEVSNLLDLNLPAPEEDEDDAPPV